MALTEEELLQQVNILATKTDEATNPNMVYKTNATLNKGLNPNYFSGQYTKIVNALNQLASASEISTTKVNDIAAKVNSILMDVDSSDNAPVWESVKELMEKDTIIEGIQHILQGQQIDKILGLDVADKGKVLSIDEDTNGNLVLKAIEAAAGGTSAEVTAEAIEYSNDQVADITNVKEALDYIVNEIVNGDFEGGLNGGTTIGEITWDMIDDRPEFIADGLELTDDQLILKDGESVLSTVPLVDNTDIDDIINQLD